MWGDPWGLEGMPLAVGRIADQFTELSGIGRSVQELIELRSFSGKIDAVAHHIDPSSAFNAKYRVSRWTAPNRIVNPDFENCSVRKLLGVSCG